MPSANLPGWNAFGHLYAAFAAHLAKTGDKVVETGVLFGKSLTYLDEQAQLRGVQLEIYGVDPFEDNGHWLPSPHPFRTIAMNLGGPYPAFCALMAKEAPETYERLHVVRKYSVEASAQFEDGALAMVLIDDAHSYEGCLASIRAWAPKVKQGGVLAGDDYHETGFPGVVKAVKEFFGEDGYHVTGTTWIAGPRLDWEAEPAHVTPPAGPQPPPSQYDGSVEGIAHEYDPASLPDLEPADGEKVLRVLDIGGNVGSFARAIRKRYEGAEVHSYEPHPEAFEKLVVVAAAMYGAAAPRFIHQVAITHPGRGKVKLYDGVSGTHEASLRDDVRWPHCSQKLDTWHEVQSIDSATLPECDILKVDTEGSECEILSGYAASGHLKSVRVLLVECHAVGGDVQAEVTRIVTIAASNGLQFIDNRGLVLRFLGKGLSLKGGVSMKLLPGLGLSDGWAKVGDSGGSWWVGKIVEEGDGEVVLSPVLECAPSRLFYPAPGAGGTMDLGTLEIAGVWSSQYGTPNRKVRVKWTSLERLTDLPMEIQSAWAERLKEALHPPPIDPRQAVAP